MSEDSSSARSPQDADGLAGIGRAVADDAVRMVRAEIDLAKAEVIGAVKSAAISIGLVLAAAAALLLAAFAVLGTLADGLGDLIFGRAWPAWGILALLFVVIAGLLAFTAYRGFRKTLRRGQATVGNIKEDVEWLKRLTKRSKNES